MGKSGLPSDNEDGRSWRLQQLTRKCDAVIQSVAAIVAHAASAI